MWSMWIKIALWKRSILALVLGFLFGIFFSEQAIYIQPIGDLFIKLLKMIITPLIFITLLHSLSQLTSAKSISILAFKSLLWFILTTIFATILAIFITEMVSPGIGLEANISTIKKASSATQPSVISTLLNVIPANPLQSFLDANILQVIFLAIIAGIALINISVKKDALIEIINTSNAMITYLISLLMEVMPFGIFALLAVSASTFGEELILKLIYLIIIMILTSMIHVFVVYSILLKIYGINVITFFKNIFEAMLIGFSTSSSTATLPTSILCAQKENIKENVYSFILPLGATINMNGSAIYQAISAVFIAQIIGFDLNFYHYFAIVITTLLASIGTAGVPGAGLLMLTLVLSVVGLPIEGIAIMAGVDRILDMIRTAVNITGDLVVAKILSK